MSSGSVPTCKFCQNKAIKNVAFAGQSHMVLKIICRQHADKLWLFPTSPLTHGCMVQVSFY